MTKESFRSQRAMCKKFSSQDKYGCEQYKNLYILSNVSFYLLSKLFKLQGIFQWRCVCQKKNGQTKRTKKELF